MYRIEFKKENLEAQDEEIGEVVWVDGEAKKVLYSTGTEFEKKRDAEMIARIFEDKFKPYPHLYKVTTEVYHVAT